MAVNTKMPLTNTADGYLCEGTDIRGSYFVIDKLENIPSTITKTGSLCFCQDDSKFYQYNGTTWTEALVIPSTDGLASEDFVKTSIENKVDSSELENYYTKTEANNEFMTQAEVDSRVNEIISKASNTDTIKDLTSLVDYLDSHGTEASEMATAIVELEANKANKKHTHDRDTLYPAEIVLGENYDTMTVIQPTYLKMAYGDDNIVLDSSNASYTINGNEIATENYVTEVINRIPSVEVNLSEFAKKTDIPDVSEFIKEIPGEYITEEELEQAINEVELKEGPQGPQGESGQSAYELWLALGNIGTEADFIAGLKGQNGEKGDPGNDGENGYTPVKGIDYFDGKDGQDGKDGIDGKDGLTTAIKVGETTYVHENGIITLPQYATKTELDNKTYPILQTSNAGIAKVFNWYNTSTTYAGGNIPQSPDSTHTRSINSISDIAERYYGIEADKDGRLFVNVPWTNTTYGDGPGISVSNGLISNSGVRSISTGTTNGTISVNTGGTVDDVSIKGLGSSAYETTYKESECTTFTSDSGNCTPAAVQKGAKLFAPEAPLTNYSKASATSAIAPTDTLSAAIGKLEKALDGKQASGNYLTSHQPIYNLEIKGDGTAAVTFVPNSANNSIDFVGDGNITITADSTNKKIKISSAYSSKAALKDGTDVSLVTTGEKYIWDNKIGTSGGIITGTLKCNDLKIDDGEGGTISFFAAESGSFDVRLPSSGKTLLTHISSTSGTIEADDTGGWSGENVVTVSYLDNYYTKDNTYAKTEIYTRAEVDELISSLFEISGTTLIIKDN